MAIDLSDLIGAPFVDGGRDPRMGLDCWGLACEVFRRYGFSLLDYQISCEDASRIDAQVAADLPEWVRCSGPYPVPALVVMRFNSQLCNHVGVHIGGGQFLHTAKRTGARVERLDHFYWARHIEGIYVPGWIK